MSQTLHPSKLPVTVKHYLFTASQFQDFPTLEFPCILIQAVVPVTYQIMAVTLMVISSCINSRFYSNRENLLLAKYTCFTVCIMTVEGDRLLHKL